MQIETHKVVTLNYTLTDDDGNVIDQSNDGSFVYLHGANNIIPGLENALSGKQAGDTLDVSVAPQEAYGERDDAKQQSVPRDMFPQDTDIEPGMQFHAQGPGGETLVVTVAKVEDDSITVDGNHLGTLRPGDALRVAAAGERITMLHPPGHDYYEVLRKKLRWSEHPS